ncbi:potassium channel family protein [Streptomyces sp. NPDC055243]|uniref:potassium channel family protein n=1 Tax=Streptomyces sp. NPDC055243 TaxID=3365720 RepID=UPI0037D7CFB0
MTTSSTEAALGWRRPAALAASTARMVTAYFVLPLHAFGPHRPVLSCLALGCGLALVAADLLAQVQFVMIGRGGTRPAWAIAGLMCLTILLFSASYYVLARQEQEFHGLQTWVDALLFTVITLATVGYGDVNPIGQTARVLTLLQVLYSFVFLTVGATTLTRYIRRRVLRPRKK